MSLIKIHILVCEKKIQKVIFEEEIKKSKISPFKYYSDGQDESDVKIEPITNKIFLTFHFLNKNLIIAKKL